MKIPRCFAAMLMVLFVITSLAGCASGPVAKHENKRPDTFMEGMRQEKKNLLKQMVQIKKEEKELRGYEPPANAVKLREEWQGKLEENAMGQKILKEKMQECDEQMRQIEADMDETRGISNICPVHHRAMLVKKVPVVIDGIGRPGDPPSQVEQNEFPFAFLEARTAGCTDLLDTHARVYFCPDCARAERAWKAAHPVRKAAGVGVEAASGR